MIKVHIIHIVLGNYKIPQHMYELQITIPFM